MGKKFKALFAAVLCLLLSLCFFACGKAELSLDRNSATMTVGESITLTAESSKGGAVTWTSDDATVVVVNDGTLVAVGAGQAKVTAEADGVSKTIIVTVRAEKEYVVTVDGVAQTVVKGALAEKPADPVKEADAQYTYTFAGWYVKGTDKAWDFSTPVDQALVIESRFDKTVNKYDVTIAEQTTAYEYGALIEAPATPAKDADAQYSYTFDGWYVVGTDDEWDFATDKVVEAVALEARFVSTVRTYKVTVNGVVSYAKYGDLVAAPAYEPTKASTATTVYTFDKWVVAGTDTAWDFEANTVAGELNIEAKFTEADRVIDVVYVVDGAEYLRAEAKHGDTVAAPAQPEKAATVSTEYVFGGWLVAGTTTAWDFEAEFDAEAVSGEVLTLVAQFTGKTREYTVTLVNGNDTDSVKVAYGNTAKLPTLTKEDEHNVYLFKGWYDEDGNLFNAGVTTVTSDITLTAEWTAQPKFYTVSYHDESGALLGEVNVKAGATASADSYVPFKNQTVANVYTFAEWVTADGLAYDFAQGVTADVKLYASYLETVRLYDVTLMDGDEVFATVKVGYNTNFSYDANADIPEYSTAGQYFVAWGEEGAEAGYTGLVLGNMTLYAITAIDTNTYTVTFKVEGCDDVVYNNVYRNDEVAYGSEVIAPTTANTAATKNVLIGWQVEGLDTVYGVDDVIRCPENGITLVAVFEEQFIYYNVSTVLANDAYTLVNENGEALTSADLSDKKWGETIKFKVVKNSVETFGTAVVKVGSSVITATDDVYSLTVISDNMITIEGLGVREYTIAGTANVLAKQATADWAKTVTSPDQALVKLTKNGEATYLDVINADGTYEIEGLRAGDYVVEFAYENAYGEKIVISDDYAKTLNYEFDADDNGEETWNVGTSNIGTIAYHSVNTSYVLNNSGVIAQDVIVGSGSKDCTAIVYEDFVPGNNDFVATITLNQDLVRQRADVAKGGISEEVCPTYGLVFFGDDMINENDREQISLFLYAEGSLRLTINRKQVNDEINSKATHLLCSSGGNFALAGWGDVFRTIEYTVVRKGDFVGVYLNAYGEPGKGVTPVVGKLMFSIDLSTGFVQTTEQMTGSSIGGAVKTGSRGEYTFPEIAEIFENVTQVELQWGITNYTAIEFYGMNYSYAEEVIDQYNAKEYTGKISVNGDTYTETVSFVGEDGINYQTKTDPAGEYIITLPVGEYTVTYGGLKSLAEVKTVTADGEDFTFEDVELDYGFRGQTFTVGSSNHVTHVEPNVTIEHDEYSETPFEDAVIYQPNINSSIVWSQPLAPNSVWGFSLDLDDNFSRYKDTLDLYDNDVYLKMYLGGLGSEFYTGLTSAGGGINLTAPNGNFFQQTTAGTWANWKDHISAGSVIDFDLMFVRDHAKITLYIRYTGDTEWFCVGYNDNAVAASGDIFYRSYLSGRSGNGTCIINYILRNPYYYEGAAGDKGAIVAENGANTEVTVDKETAGLNEIVTVTATPASKHAVTAYVINGKTYPVTVGTNTYKFSAVGYTDYTVSAIAEPTEGFVTLHGNVDFSQPSYKNYYSLATGTVTATGADGKVYGGNIVDGKYTISLPEGEYDLYASTDKMQGWGEATVAGETTKDVILSSFHGTAYNYFEGNGMTPRKDGSIAWKYWSVQQTTGFEGVSFVPNKQIVEFGYTLTGNLSGMKYPIIGGRIWSADKARAGGYWTGNNGDQAFLMAKDSWVSRLKCSNEPWLQWKGGFLCGQEDSSWDAIGTFYANSWMNMDFKFRVDGYVITVWIKGTNYHGGGSASNITLNDWTQCCSINIYDRYTEAIEQGILGADGATSHTVSRDGLYKLDDVCYFGPTARVDGFVGHYCPPTFENLWFNVYEK